MIITNLKKALLSVGLLLIIVMSSIALTHVYIIETHRPVNPTWQGSWVSGSWISKTGTFSLHFKELGLSVKYAYEIQSVQVLNDSDLGYDSYIILVRVYRKSDNPEVVETFSRVNVTLNPVDTSKTKPYAFVDSWWPDQRRYDFYYSKAAELHVWNDDEYPVSINLSASFTNTYISVDTGSNYITWTNEQTYLGVFFITSAMGANGDACWISKFVVPDASHDGSVENSTLAGTLHVTITLEATIMYTFYTIKNSTTVEFSIDLYDTG